MPLPDGPRLRTDITLPDDGARHPVMLIRTPYSRAGLRAGHDPIGLARAGWAVAFQDVRGRFDSEGVFSPLEQEGRDGQAAVEWCARQPWSTGAVVMAGASYNGYTQWAAAVRRPRGLVGMAPTLTAPYLMDSFLGEGGAFRVGTWTLWALDAAWTDTAAPARARRRAQSDSARWTRLVGPPLQTDRIASHLPAFAEWHDADRRRSWARADPGRRLKQVTVPAYHLTGWYDLFVEGSLAAYQQLTSSTDTNGTLPNHRLVVGPWAHISQLQQFVGEVDFGTQANALARGIPGEQIEFLARAARGDAPAGGVSVFVMGDNRWLDLESWPPPAADRELFLASEGPANGGLGGGRLLDTAPEQAGSDRYHHDPADPVPTRGGRHLLRLAPPPGPIDQRPVERRDDLLFYTGEPLQVDLTIVGTIRAFVAFQSSARQADLAVKVLDVHPDGAAMNVCDGIRRISPADGRTRMVEVRAGSTAMTFRRGHRIRIEIASANFPHFDCLDAADQVVRWGGRLTSRLVLPVLRVGR